MAMVAAVIWRRAADDGGAGNGEGHGDYDDGGDEIHEGCGDDGIDDGGGNCL